MKQAPNQPPLQYTTTPTVPVETTEAPVIPLDTFREIDGRIIREMMASYAKRYGHALTRELIKALADKYAFG